MGLLGMVGSAFKVITGPLGILEDWATEPLKRWEHNRQETAKDRDLERRIREQTGVEETKARLERENATLNAELEAKKIQEQAKAEESKARLERENASHAAELEIRMKTEIQRINAETEQWTKDKDFERMRLVTEAVMQYQERLMDANLRIVNAIGNMNLELRAKAQALILEKTQEYKQIQDQATKDAEEEFVRITEKFSSNERVLNIMISNSEKKLASIVNATGKFLEELSIDIANLNSNIDRLTQLGHQHALKQLEGFNTIAPQMGQGQRRIEEASFTELPSE